jgi:phosphoribosylaminoimidazole carboxylase (NCAIR synthetase)
MQKQLPLGSNIGIIGGGQLGRMTTMAAAILAGKYPEIKAALRNYRKAQTENVPNEL